MALLYLQFVLDQIIILLYLLFVLLQKFYRLFVPGTPKSLKNEIVLVTGGGGGLGREICRKLASVEKSLTIICWDVNEKENKVTVDELRKLGVNAHAFTVDVTDQKQVEASAKHIRREFGDVSILFNNAGIAGEVKLAWEMNPDMVRKVMEVNILSHYWTMMAFLPAMIRNGKGHIVEICSVLGFFYSSHGSSYIASKYAVRGFTEAVKEDVRRMNLPKSDSIVFTLVYPQVMDTTLLSGVQLLMKYEFLSPRLSPKYVAREVVEGVRRNREYIYVTEVLRILHFFISTFPSEVIRKNLELVGMRVIPTE